MKFVGTLLQQHLSRYPQMELADIYKLLHQAALGNGHAVRDAAAARAALNAELLALEPGVEEPLIDPISPDGKLVRVHLRPYAQAGHAAEQLARAFVETALAWQPAQDKLERFCGCVGDFAAAGALAVANAAAAFDANEVRAYFAQIAAAGYPVVHHSPGYRAAYRPAYRVVHLDLLSVLT